MELVRLLLPVLSNTTADSDSYYQTRFDVSVLRRVHFWRLWFRQSKNSLLSFVNEIMEDFSVLNVSASGAC
jgi:hypothetical protein